MSSDVFFWGFRVELLEDDVDPVKIDKTEVLVKLTNVFLGT